MDKKRIELTALDQRIAEGCSRIMGIKPGEIRDCMSDPVKSKDFWDQLENKITERAGVNNGLVALFNQKKAEEAIYETTSSSKAKEAIGQVLVGEDIGSQNMGDAQQAELLNGVELIMEKKFQERLPGMLKVLKDYAAELEADILNTQAKEIGRPREKFFTRVQEELKKE